jgi:hypothetical protein
MAYRYKVTLKMHGYCWDVQPAKRIDIKETFMFESWSSAAEMIKLMVGASSDTISIDIEKEEIKTEGLEDE